MINVTLKGGVVKEYENGTSVMDIAKSLGAGLFKAACLARVNGEICDLRTKLESDCEVEILTFDEDEAKKWLSNGAQPSDTAKALLKKAGVIGE